MSLLKLNIYDNKGKIKKTFETSYFFVSTKIVEKVFKLIDIDDLLTNNTLINGVDKEEEKKELGLRLLKVVVKNWEEFKQIIIGIFDGVTFEDLENTNPSELVNLIILILNDAITSLNNIGTTEKN